jgi:undecaprenyl diphosphate synthase
VARLIDRPTDSPSIVHRERQAPADPTGGSPAQEAAVAPGVLPAPDVPEVPAARAGEAFAVTPEEMPRHVAIIMDGNRRWARARGLTEMEGHAAGVEGIREIIRHAVRRGIEVLSLYAFSRENWARSDEEVSGLFMLLERVIRNETAELVAQGARVRLLGRLEELPPETQASLKEALDATVGGRRLQLNIAFNYSGRTELVDAARKVVAQGLRPEEIDEDVMAAAMYTTGLPDPDMVIRTGGDERLSNFLIWQSAYAEIVFTPTLWPDFGPAELDAALVEFASRQRRFGR